MLGAAIRDHVLSAGHAVDWMRRIDDARLAVGSVPYELILLDLGLPDGRGLDLLRELRAAGNTVPVIITTAQDQVAIRIEGLNAGADDYLVKPFDLAEMSARIAAVARRYGGNPIPTVVAAGVAVDLAQRKIKVDGKPVRLTAREWAVLERLALPARGDRHEGGDRGFALCLRRRDRKQCRRGLHQPVAQEAGARLRPNQSWPWLPGC